LRRAGAGDRLYGFRLQWRDEMEKKLLE